ncbi:MAG: metallophosphoesterase [Clostridia bacterium]|nr:metallophosphoesterase [Clostridia bacterium]
MKLVFLRGTSLIVAMFMLTLFAYGGANKEPFDVKEPDECVLDLTVFSDVHVEGNNPSRYKIFASSLINSMQNKSGSDAYIFLGDSTMNGQNIENMMFHGAVKLMLKDQKVITIPGNHDFGNGEGNFKKIQQRWYDYTEAFFGTKLTTPYYYDTVNGFYFIVLANEEQNIDSMFMSDDQYAWLELMLEDAAHSGLPVFVLAHYPPGMSKPINPDSQYNLIRILADYNREHDLFYLCGHLHREPQASSFHTWNGFPDTYLPALTMQTENREIYEQSGFGELVEVYSDRVVFRMRNFYYGEWALLDGSPLEATHYLKNPIPAA